MVATGGAATLPVNEFPGSMRRMWTKGDWAHVHAITGTAHTMIGFVYLCDVIAGDVARLNGAQWTPIVSFDVVVWSIVFGAVNAISGMQPSLIPGRVKDVAQLFGFGEDGNLKAAGFLNTCGFYFFLTYQGVRVLPEYPEWLMPFDPIFALTTIAFLFHAVFIINSWVGKGLSQGLAIGICAPLMLNMPVSLHLMFEGQSWVAGMTAIYPQWPQLFFVANYCLAWAGSVAAFVLSLYERRVIDLTQRLIIFLLIGAFFFALIPLEAYQDVPTWFFDEWQVMLTLTPPIPPPTSAR